MANEDLNAAILAELKTLNENLLPIRKAADHFLLQAQRDEEESLRKLQERMSSGRDGAR